MSDDKPICYDLYCGLGGWAEGFLAEGYECRGYDIEAHDYGTGGYPGELILRDTRQVHGSLLKDAACLVFSPPCQEYSYMAMPWERAKQIARALHGQDQFPAGYRGSRTVEQLNELFNTCYRIQREACEAAGHYIPMVIENVRGAQKWVGRAKANYGSFYLWGDVGMVGNRVVCIVNGKLLGGRGVSAMKAAKVPGFRFDGESHGSFQSAAVKTTNQDGRKHDGSGWTEKGSLASHNRLVPNSGLKVPGIKLSEVGFNVAAAQRYRADQRESDAVKQGGDWFGANCESSMSRMYGSKSPKRKAASAMIAKIPFALGSHIAKCFYPVSL